MKKLFNLILTFTFAAALLLVSSPGLHAKQHDVEHGHHKQHDCQICHVLSGFVMDPPAISLDIVPTFQSETSFEVSQNSNLNPFFALQPSRAPPRF